MGVRDQGCGVGCSCPPGEGSRDYCWAHCGRHGAGPPGGPGTQTAGTPGCGRALGSLEALDEPARLKGREKGRVALDTRSLLLSAGTTLMAFPSPGTVF